jgi:penicillin-binding protein 1A
MRVIHLLRTAFYFGLLAAGIGAAALIVFFFATVPGLPQVPEPLSRIIETPPTEIYAATGARILLIGGREAVALNRVSPAFIQAVVATEDHRFWEHQGLDKLRTLKAFWVTLIQRGRVQGASTITQQLAKNLFFSFHRTYWRKFRELLVALQIEARFSKSEILEAYVNQIAFGVEAHGVEQAARVFFGKPALQLSLPEAALLAGLPKSPTRYNPFRYFDRAKDRQRVVLNRMVAVGYVAADEAEAAYRAVLNLKPRGAEAPSGSHFLDLVMKDLEERYGSDVVHHAGLKVFTTLDPRMQALATEAVQGGLEKLDTVVGAPPPLGGGVAPARIQGALVALEVHSGAVRALVGGRDHAESEFNRAVQSNRQPGSGFKPFVYYAAFEKLGLSPATVMVDRKVSLTPPGQAPWSPKNFSGQFEGPMVLKRGLSQSVNSISAQLMERTGPQAVIEVARRCGVSSPLAPVYSLALGTSGVSPLDMAGAFATLAAGGIRHDPFWIRRVEDPLGRILEERILGSRRVLDVSLTFQVVDMMRAVLDGGTAAGVRQMGFQLPAAGKTGTTDEFNDAWFTGFTPTLSVSVWVGFDRGVSMRDAQGRGVTGGRGAAPIWAEFMRRATEGEPAREFPVPADIRFRTINPLTGQAALPWESRRMEVALREGQDAGIRPAAETPPAPAEAPAPPAASHPDERPPDTRSESPPVRTPGGGPQLGQSAGGASTGGYVGGH